MCSALDGVWGTEFRTQILRLFIAYRGVSRRFSKPGETGGARVGGSRENWCNFTRKVVKTNSWNKIQIWNLIFRFFDFFSTKLKNEGINNDHILLALYILSQPSSQSPSFIVSSVRDTGRGILAQTETPFIGRIPQVELRVTGVNSSIDIECN